VLKAFDRTNTVQGLYLSQHPTSLHRAHFASVQKEITCIDIFHSLCHVLLGERLELPPLSRVALLQVGGIELYTTTGKPV
jgi:hypothetical protein